MSLGVGLLIVLLAVWHVDVSETLECFSCTNIPIISDCSLVVKCSLDEECFTEARGLGNSTDYTLGCRPFAQCRRTSTASPVSIVGRMLDDRSSQSSIVERRLDDRSSQSSIVGRMLDDRSSQSSIVGRGLDDRSSQSSIVGRGVDDRSSQSSMGCQQCCGTDYCNKKICNSPTQIITSTDGQCHDDPDYNCELISGTFNICGDVAHAKTVCRKWCGLCPLVDGNWSSWSTWMGCSVSCGQGQRLRNRSCTEPIPSHGGLDCVGSQQDVSYCSVRACPLHGGWSGWSAWGSCSVSCGVGLQRRDRSCSRPYPGPDGNPCFGDARDDRVCLAGACTDGAWSTWTTWSVCSASCNGGLVSRSRSCDNPGPSILGKQCVGQYEEYHTCNTHACPAPVVVFSVYSPRRTLSNGRTDSGVVIYRTIVTNVGSGYNITSGEFACSVPGIYSFDISILHSGTAGGSSCYIQHNGHNIAVADTYDSSSVADGHHAASASVYLTLIVGDIVDVYCGGFQNLFSGMYATFNGALVSST